MDEETDPATVDGEVEDDGSRNKEPEYADMNPIPSLLHLPCRTKMVFFSIFYSILKAKRKNCGL